MRWDAYILTSAITTKPTARIPELNANPAVWKTSPGPTGDGVRPATLSRHRRISVRVNLALGCRRRIASSPGSGPSRCPALRSARPGRRSVRHYGSVGAGLRIVGSALALAVTLACSDGSEDQGSGTGPTLGTDVFWPGDELGLRLDTPEEAVRAFLVDVLGQEPTTVRPAADQGRSFCCVAMFTVEVSGLLVDVSAGSYTSGEDSWYVSGVGGDGLVGLTTGGEADGIHARPPRGSVDVEFVYRDAAGTHSTRVTAADAERGVKTEADSITSVVGTFRGPNGTLLAIDGGSVAD